MLTSISIIYFVVLAVLVLAAVILLISYYSFRVAFHAPVKKRTTPEFYIEKYDSGSKEDQKVKELMKEFVGIEYEKVCITSFDGLKLSGRYYHVKDSAPIEIAFHGYRSHAQRDFCGGSQICLKNGYNLLVVDQRAHGESDGKIITFGINERFDCLAWANYAAERFGENTKIILSGVSMGAATVLMASSLDLPKNVVCIAADCPYSSPSDIIKRVCRQKRLNPRFFYPFIKLGARLFGHFDLEQGSAVSAVSKTDIPILLVHGQADDFVPIEMSRKIFNACRSKKEFFSVPGADHAMSFIKDKESYTKTVLEFYKKFAG